MANPLLSLLDVFSILCCVLSSVSAFAFFRSRPQVPLSSLSQLKLKPIGNWAALGDSYAAGIGAGKRLPGWSSYGCSRYNSSYPHLLHSNDAFSSNETKFDYLACSGATSDDIAKNQVSKLPAESIYDLITLSAGGNDVGLSDVLNACIFQWSGGNGDQCDDQLNQTTYLVNTTLSKKMDELHTALIPHLSTNGIFFQTGYAKFFDASDAACDNITWSFWYAQYLGWEQQYLTRERRQQMNDLVDTTNTIIQESIERIPALTNRSDINVKFINYDPVFGVAKGRFCEPGVEEPAPDRAGLLFYEWDTTDDTNEREHGPDGLNPHNTTDGSFEGKIVKWIEEGRKKHPKALIRAHQRQGQIDEQSRIIPDGYLRVFHPRPGGHAIMAQNILVALAEHQEHEDKKVSERPEM